jgi:GNAT superfamily N-acetyltransferase
MDSVVTTKLDVATDIRVLRTAETAAFAKFTFPAYRECLLRGQESQIVAIGLVIGGEPAGLALGSISPAVPDQAAALSFFVTASNRRNGLGRRLLDAFERELARRGSKMATGQLTGSDDRSLATERLLTRAGWQFSGPTAVLCHAEQKTMVRAPWLAAAKLPDDMEIFPWLDLRAEERADMLERQARAPWIPENLSPFWNEHLIAGCSVGMRYRGRVAGWCVAYTFEGGTLRWWRLFVEKELQRSARAIPLLAESIRRLPQYGFDSGVWSVSADNQAMIRLLERRMRPWLLTARPVWVVSRSLLHLSSTPTEKSEHLCGAGEQLLAFTGEDASD